tara:strand:- start:3325 stop:3615 length:291 start_codon:yes stop_codon:yes gene_type:complete
MSHHLKFLSTHPPFRVNDYSKVDLIRRELRAIIKHQDSLYIEDTELGLENVLYEVLEILDGYLDYEPSDEDMGGEPPMTMAEMHAGAWEQHVAMHS